MEQVDPIQHQRDLAERRAAWEEQRQVEAEVRERQEKQARLNAYLAAKRQSWLDFTGEIAPEELKVQWQLEFLAEREAADDAERAERLLNAANNSPL